ncbi:MAG: hypothetical protein AABO58_10360 [Acidobacteriota bacterium]
MQLTVEVVATGDGPAAGSPVIVQIRDAALQDAAATTVAEARTRSRAARQGEPLARVELSYTQAGEHPFVWVHVDVDNSGDVSAGDYLTMQSYPVRGETTMRVEVRLVQ